MSEYVFHKIRSIGVIDNHTLCAQFDCGIAKKYDIRPLTNKYPVFVELIRDIKTLKQVKVDIGGYGIVWSDNLDLSSEEIWNNGEIVVTDFDNEMSFADASALWNIEESTLRKAATYGKLVAGIDCWKFGKQWVVSKKAMIREYGYCRKFDENNCDLIAAENETKYGNER